MLRPQDIQMLKESNISDEVRDARGYLFIEKKDCKDYGFKPWQSGDGLLVPLYNVDQEIRGYQLRRDDPRISKEGKEVKYETPYKDTNFLDVNPLMADEVRKGKQAIFITEGAKKVDALATIKIPAVGLKGVWNWLGTNEDGGSTTLSDWRDIALKGNIIVIAFDSDVYTNPSVYKAMKELRNWLFTKKVHRVRFLHLPYDPDKKLGVDDYLASMHKENNDNESERRQHTG